MCAILGSEPEMLAEFGLPKACIWLYNQGKKLIVAVDA